MRRSRLAALYIYGAFGLMFASFGAPPILEYRGADAATVEAVGWVKVYLLAALIGVALIRSWFLNSERRQTLVADMRRARISKREAVLFSVAMMGAVIASDFILQFAALDPRTQKLVTDLLPVVAIGAVLFWAVLRARRLAAERAKAQSPENIFS